MGEAANLIRSVLTVLGMICFLLIVFWAFGKRAKSEFIEAEQLPFADDDGLKADQSHRPASNGAKQ